MEILRQLDHNSFLFLNGLAGKNMYLDWLVIFIGQYLIFVIILIIISHLFLGRRDLFFTALVSGFMAEITNRIISLIHFRYRPFISLSDRVTLLINHNPDKSFPSDHAILAFALATIIIIKSKGKWGWVLLVFAILISLARVIAGLHYPADITAGAILGVLIALAVSHLSIRISIKNNSKIQNAKIKIQKE